jgi:hypothetical protein
VRRLANGAKLGSWSHLAKAIRWRSGLHCTRLGSTLLVATTNAITQWVRRRPLYLDGTARSLPPRLCVLLGDARLVLERQLKEGDAQGFDFLVLDAFRGTSPPLHLMTAEAFEIHFSHLAADGILAINFEIDTSKRRLCTAEWRGNSV